MRTRRIGAGIAFAWVACGVGAQQPIVVQTLSCSGGEPLWRLEASRTTGTYSALTAKGKREVVFRGTLQTLASATPPMMVWRGDSTHLPRETLVVTVREETCRSSAAGNPASTHRAMLSLKSGEAVAGCCTVRSAYDARSAPVVNFAARSPDDWARFLPDLMPAITSCLARSGGRAKWISKAEPVAQKQATVRVVEMNGQAFDCTVALSGRGVPSIERVSPDALPGVRNGVPATPLFYPVREPPPMVSCGRLERVLGKNNAVQGYLHYDPC